MERSGIAHQARPQKRCNTADRRRQEGTKSSGRGVRPQRGEAQQRVEQSSPIVGAAPTKSIKLAGPAEQQAGCADREGPTTHGRRRAFVGEQVRDGTPRGARPE